MSTYFASDIDSMFELLDMPICVSTSMGESLVVDHVYWGCIMVFSGQAYLILLNMIDFDVVLGMD